jgi:hypothetical protein
MCCMMPTHSSAVPGLKLHVPLFMVCHNGKEGREPYYFPPLTSTCLRTTCSCAMLRLPALRSHRLQMPACPPQAAPLPCYPKEVATNHRHLITHAHLCHQMGDGEGLV